jgi:hypothetical protein
VRSQDRGTTRLFQQGQRQHAQQRQQLTQNTNRLRQGILQNTTRLTALGNRQIASNAATVRQGTAQVVAGQRQGTTQVVAGQRQQTAQLGTRLQQTGTQIDQGLQRQGQAIQGGLQQNAQTIGGYVQPLAGHVQQGTAATTALLGVERRAWGLASGAIVHEPTRALIGEAGDPEAVIPLNDQSRSHELLRETARRMGYELVGGGPALNSIAQGGDPTGYGWHTAFNRGKVAQYDSGSYLTGTIREAMNRWNHVGTGLKFLPHYGGGGTFRIQHSAPLGPGSGLTHSSGLVEISDGSDLWLAGHELGHVRGHDHAHGQNSIMGYNSRGQVTGPTGYDVGVDRNRWGGASRGPVRVPGFENGGVVPGSGPRLTVLHGGETVVPTRPGGPGATELFASQIGQLYSGVPHWTAPKDPAEETADNTKEIAENTNQANIALEAANELLRQWTGRGLGIRIGGGGGTGTEGGGTGTGGGGGGRRGGGGGGSGDGGTIPIDEGGGGRRGSGGGGGGGNTAPSFDDRQVSRDEKAVLNQRHSGDTGQVNRQSQDQQGGSGRQRMSQGGGGGDPKSMESSVERGAERGTAQGTEKGMRGDGSTTTTQGAQFRYRQRQVGDGEMVYRREDSGTQVARNSRSQNRSGSQSGQSPRGRGSGTSSEGDPVAEEVRRGQRKQDENSRRLEQKWESKMNELLAEVRRGLKVKVDDVGPKASGKIGGKKPSDGDVDASSERNAGSRIFHGRRR